MEKATANHNVMAASKQPQCDFKVQPWKKHWPPQTEATKGEEHGALKGVMLEQDGTNGAIARLHRALQ